MSDQGVGSLTQAAKALTEGAIAESTQKLNSHKPARRGHKTRKNILDAAIRCLCEEGYSSSSTYRIIERAGVTWGSLQYHFGGKAGLNSAVIQLGMEALEEGFNNFVVEGTSLNERVCSFVDKSWECFRHSHTRAGFEVIMNASHDLDADCYRKQQLEMSKVLRQIVRNALDRAIGARVECAGIEGLITSAFRGFSIVLRQNEDQYEFKLERQALSTMITAVAEQHN